MSLQHDNLKVNYLLLKLNRKLRKMFLGKDRNRKVVNKLIILPWIMKSLITLWNLLSL